MTGGMQSFAFFAFMLCFLPLRIHPLYEIYYYDTMETLKKNI